VTDGHAPQKQDGGTWWDFSSAAPDHEPPDIDTATAHSARIYDYILGGKGNISQVVSVLPYSGHTSPIQSPHAFFSNIGLLAVR
jgi:hypothetical protein